MNHLNSIILEGVVKQIDEQFLTIASTKGDVTTLVKCRLSYDIELKQGSLIRIVGELVNYNDEVIIDINFVEVRETESTIKSGGYTFKL